MLIDSVSTLLVTLLPLAEGRGENPQGVGGVLIIVLAIVTMVLVVAAILTLIARRTRG